MQRSGADPRPPPRVSTGVLAAGAIHLNCSRCGLTITPRADGLAVEHYPRCMTHRRAVVRMFASTLPTDELYAYDSSPALDRSDAAGALRTERAASGNEPAVDELRWHRGRKARLAPDGRSAA